MQYPLMVVTALGLILLAFATLMVEPTHAGTKPASDSSVGSTASAVQEQITIKPDRKPSAKDIQHITQFSQQLLNEVNKTRQLIAAKKPDEAILHLNDAQILIGKIQKIRPTVRIIDHIWKARTNLDYKTTEEVADDLIPVAASLQEIERLVPVDKAQDKLQSARQQLKAGEKEAGRQSLREVEKALIYSEVDLPLAATTRHLNVAQGFLRDNNPSKADQELKATQESLRGFTVAVDEAR